jgi:hypothetical protein
MWFATNQYATSMQLIVIYNFLDHVCNYKFFVLLFLGHTLVRAIN